MNATNCRWLNLLPIIMGGPIKIRPPGWSFTLIVVLVAFVLGWTVHALVQTAMPLRP